MALQNSEFWKAEFVLSELWNAKQNEAANW